uniref:Tyrosine-protein phosphatase domain-containing protein n=1 Tax=Heterorhabditis bacteriophora TaxID=37862 RepID=A0A1I7X390_HETBA
MVANLYEKNRQQCTKYWPDDEPTRLVDFINMYGNLLVIPCEATYFADYAVRCFDVTPVSDKGNNRLSPSGRSDFGSIESSVGSEYANVPSIRQSKEHVETSFGGGTARRIVQYHFTNWNDYKAPECSTGLLRFLHRLRALPQFNDFPVVIHCSSQEQYVFVYKALAEWYLFGYTDMDEHYQMLLEPGMRRCFSQHISFYQCLASGKQSIDKFQMFFSTARFMMIRNGSSETGVYCCISLLLERLKAEQRIDVFQTVKGLQNQRPLMFSKLVLFIYSF